MSSILQFFKHSLLDLEDLALRASPHVSEIFKRGSRRDILGAIALFRIVDIVTFKTDVPALLLFGHNCHPLVCRSVLINVLIAESSGPVSRHAEIENE